MADTDISVAALAKKSYLIPSQKRQIQESINHLNFMMKDPETREVAMPNTDRLASNLQKDTRMLKEGTPPDYDALTKNKLNSLRRKLETEIRHGMPTADMMEKPTPNNIDLHIWWERENTQRIAAWKAVCRSLDPNNDEPNFTNIARLRPSTPPAGNPRKYWQNFDAITWEKDVEEGLGVTIDDETYRTFLELKALEWAPTNIKRELQLTDAMYEATMERLRSNRFRSDAQRDEHIPALEAARAEAKTKQRNGQVERKHYPDFAKKLQKTGLRLDEFADNAGVHATNLRHLLRGNAVTLPTWDKIDKALAKLMPAEGETSALPV